MMQKILFILILLLAVCSPAVVHADKPSHRDSSIVVKNISIVGTTVGTSLSTNSKAESAHSVPAEPATIAITYEITNASTTRKFTLEQNRKLRLTDEFGNVYRQAKAPKGVVTLPIPDKDVDLISLYPNEKYTATVFFEAPIPVAKKLKLSCAASDLGLTKPVDLFIDITNRSALMPIGMKDNHHPTLAVRIVDPPGGTILNQGDVVHVRIMAEGDKPPHKIIVIALNTYYEDKTPAFENVYDLNIPIEQPAGNYLINVIAEWPGTTADNNITLSDTLSFDVQESVPLPAL